MDTGIIVGFAMAGLILLTTLVSCWIVDRMHKRHLAEYERLIARLEALSGDE